MESRWVGSVSLVSTVLVDGCVDCEMLHTIM